MHKLPHPRPMLSAKENELSDIPTVTPPARSWFWFSKRIIGKSTCCCRASYWTELGSSDSMPVHDAKEDSTKAGSSRGAVESMKFQWEPFLMTERNGEKNFFPHFTHFPGRLTGTVGTQNASRVITYSLRTFAMPSPKGLLWVCHLYHWHIIISLFTACV